MWTEGAEMNRHLLDAWMASTEATLKATFELQNSAIQAGRSFMETGLTSNQTAYNQWVEAIQQAQKAAMEAWHVTRRAADKMKDMPLPGVETPAR
jgi:urease accessory protein UreF